ncbi:MAG: CsgG/HfaB family protein [Planctomycetota bacterium]|jgi:TolB-like protein
MKNALSLLVYAAISLFSYPLVAEDQQPADEKPAATSRPATRTIFAAPFENETDQEQYDPAAAGMGDLISVLLAEQEHVTVVERQRLEALTEEQALALKGLTGKDYAIAAGKLLEADTVLTGRLFLVEGKLTVSAQALDIESARMLAADQTSCRPAYLAEAALQLARRLGEQMALPLPEIDIEKIDKSPIASLHFAKALSHYYSGNMDAAIMQFMRTMDLDPDYVEAHYWSGMAYHRLGEDAHAVIEWEKFLDRRPESKHAEKVKKLLAETSEREKESTVEPPAPESRPAEAEGETSSGKGEDE